jgi:hypothetical protein
LFQDSTAGHCDGAEKIFSREFLLKGNPGKRSAASIKSRGKTAVFTLLFLVFAALPAYGAAFARYSGPGVVIRYEPHMRNAAASVADLYPRVKADLEAKTGWRVDFSPQVVLIRENRVFLKIAGSELITAFAVPGQDLIVIDYAKMERTPFDLKATTEHELCHLLVHRRISLGIPRWLDEGVAQWASGGIADILNPGEKDILKQAVLSGRIIPLAALSAAFSSGPREMILAYQESKSFIDFIVHEYGTDGLRAVLHEMADGRTVSRAFSSALPADLNVLEKRWREGLVRKYSWSSYASDQIYWLLFIAAAFITFIGYLRLRHRMKNYRDEEEDEEGGFSGPGDNR